MLIPLCTRTIQNVGQAAEAPVAGFTAAPRFGEPPLSVAFTDTSTGAVTSWSWTFGDGGTSIAQHPTHVYAALGSYTVTLAVSGPGGTHSETKVDTSVLRNRFRRAFSCQC